MAKFTDADGREWPVEISVAALKRMRDHADGFRLDDILPKSPKGEDRDVILERYQDFLNDDLRFAAVLWAIVMAPGIDQEQLDHGLRGGANQRAIAAFHEAFTDFSTPQQKLILLGIKTMADKTTAAIAIATNRLNKEIAKFDDNALENSVNGEIDRALSEAVGNSLATSA